MLIFPAIDIIGGKAVRLFKGDYNQMTVYNDDVLQQARQFEALGATHLHIVDLDGAKSGRTDNLTEISRIVKGTSLFIELGGGIRNIQTIEKYLSIGVDRLILGTAAVTDEEFLIQAVKKFKEKIAVGVDVKDGFVCVKGWTEKSAVTIDDLCEKIQRIGVKTIICTDISKDGAMNGTNIEMYKSLCKKYAMDVTASGGVSSIEDIIAIKQTGAAAAIVGKAYYTGAVDLKKAIEVAL